MKFLKDKLKLRLYQQAILGSCIEKNTLVVISTGLGKTFIAIGLAGLVLDKGQVVVMAPTKPLCVQHQKTFSEFFEPKEELVVLTGAVPPDERKKIWGNKLVFATPQTVENDVLRGFVKLENIALLVVDEAHRATGDYAYTWIAKQYRAKNEKGKILALTASPASEKEKLDEVCRNLFISKIEVRKENDADVSEYIKQKEIERIYVELPDEMQDIKTSLEGCLKQRLNTLKEMELIESAELKRIRKVQLLKLQGQFIRNLTDDPAAYKAISVLAGAIKVMHALELLQTQGIYSLAEFFKKIAQQAKRVKASGMLMGDLKFKKAMALTYGLRDDGIEHPKYDTLKGLVSKNLKPKSRIIVFTNYRSSVNRIVGVLSKMKGVRPVKFIGQKDGLTQKKQVEVLERFKDGDFNVLVATSISEEGLHIENADIGVFFEPVPSALRSIQRRGRVGRINIGKIYLLITKGTIDESYYWVAQYKEKRMGEMLKDLKKDIEKPRESLKEFVDG